MMRLITLLVATTILASCATTTTQNDQEKIVLVENKSGLAYQCLPTTFSIFFDTAVSGFDAKATETLDLIAGSHNVCEAGRLEVFGYTDSVGDSETNLELSESRAEKVVNALMQRGVTAASVRITPLGESTTRAEDTPDAELRKVTVTLIP